LTTPNISNNNIQDNVKYNFYLGKYTSDNVDAVYNWWGTTDQSVISNLIFDNKNDFNLGKVIFEPILMMPNSEAMPDSDIPLPVPDSFPPSSPSPNPEPEINPPSSPDESGTTIQPDQSNAPDSGDVVSTGFNVIEIAILAVLIVIATGLIALVVLVSNKKR
jgi:hypothetical protein